MKESKARIEKIEKNTKEAEKDTFKDYVPYLIIIASVVLIRSFILTPINVQGTSMVPTLNNNDVMILYKLTKNIRGIKRFDVVVVKTDSGKLIKRVIGLPGETIKYSVEENDDGSKTATLYIDGKEIKEDFLPDEYRVKTCVFDTVICEKEILLGEDEYFVMGDNRGSSRDSRVIGPVKKEKIEGTTKLVIYPFDRMGNIK